MIGGSPATGDPLRVPPVPPVPSPAHASRPRTRARRLVALAMLVAVAVIGLAVHAFLPDTAATDIAGDALYALAAYVGLIALAPRWSPLVVGAVAGAWCVAVELFQLTGIPLALGARFTPAMLLLGTVFDPRDLVVYVVTIVLATAADVALRRVFAAR